MFREAKPTKQTTYVYIRCVLIEVATNVLHIWVYTRTYRSKLIGSKY